MKLAVMLMSFAREIRAGHITIPDVIAICSELGLDGIELANTEIAHIAEDELRCLLAQARLELAMYIILTDFVHEDPHVLADAVSKVNQEIDKASRLGANKVLIVPGNPKAGISDELGRELIAKGLQVCARYGATQGIKVTNENYGVYAGFRGRMQHMEEFLQKAPDLWTTYDDGNFLLADEDPMVALEHLSGRMVHVHLKDWIMVDKSEAGTFPVPRRPGCFYKVAAVGEGIMPTAEIVQELKAKGYQGYLSIEHGGQVPGRQGLADAVTKLRQYLGH